MEVGGRDAAAAAVRLTYYCARYDTTCCCASNTTETGLCASFDSLVLLVRPPVHIAHHLVYNVAQFGGGGLPSRSAARELRQQLLVRQLVDGWHLCVERQTQGARAQDGVSAPRCSSASGKQRQGLSPVARHGHRTIVGYSSRGHYTAMNR